MRRLRAITGIVALLLLADCTAASGQPAGAGQPSSYGQGSGSGHGAGHGLGSAEGTVTGRLVREGGPLGPGGTQPAERLLPGSVQFTAARGRSVVVQVGTSGRFSVRLPSGTYSVSGRSPDIMEVSANGSQHETVCSVPLHVTITPPHTAKIDVICVVP
jgi:hypothetical protein